MPHPTTFTACGIGQGSTKAAAETDAINNTTPTVNKIFNRITPDIEYAIQESQTFNWTYLSLGVDGWFARGPIVYDVVV